STEPCPDGPRPRHRRGTPGDTASAWSTSFQRGRILTGQVSTKLWADPTDGIRSMHGDAIAEEVLESVRWRARSVIRSSDLLSLSDNDELVIVLRGLRDLHDAQTVSAKIQRCIGEPIVVRDHKFHISTTAGMAMADDDETAITLTQQMREALLTRPAR
ncbi:MAG: diguanylate cyclase, partial [Actinobacteria bacterium]|nr:diguanylate cyclase [Actinomycetota bacterium]